MLFSSFEGLKRPGMSLYLDDVTSWWHSLDCVFFWCVPSSCLVCLFCCGGFIHSFQHLSAQLPLGVFITGGACWNLVNPLILLWISWLARPWCSLLLGEMLFTRRAQCPWEPLGYGIPRGYGIMFLYRLCSSPSLSYWRLRKCLAWSRGVHNLAWFRFLP